MSDVLVKPAFQSNALDSGDPTKLGPAAWNAARLFSGGVDGQIVTKSAASATGAAWVDSIPTSRTVNGHALSADVIVTKGDLGLGNVENTALSTWGGSTNLITLGAASAASLAVTGALTAPIGATGNKTFLQALLSDHGAVGHYNFAVGYASNAGDAARGDHVLTIGYNTAALGGRANLSEPCFEWRIEDYYAPGGGSPGPYMEAHWQYYDATGAGVRPIACQIDRTNGGYLTNTALTITANAFSYLAMNGVQYVKFMQNDLVLFNSCLLDIAVNNYACVRQLNAAGNAYLSLGYIDNANYLRLGVGGSAAVAITGSLFVGSPTGCKLTNFADQGMTFARADGTGAYFVLVEQTDPGPAPADQAKFYVRDNGSGKTQLCVLFSSGAVQVLATQP